MLRAALVLAVLLAPLATSATTVDSRELVVNHVRDTRCPSLSLPATIGCFHAPANATSVSIVARADAGNAQPRFFVRVYNGSMLQNSFFHCEDFVTGATGATDVYVELLSDRSRCGDSRMGTIPHGSLTATWS